MVYSQIWTQSGRKDDSEKIFFYFDADYVVIYPEEAGGFDRVFARIHINNVFNENGGGFFSSYTVKSLKKKSAVLLTPKKLSSFIEDLKVLIDLNADATFKLIQ